MVLTMSHQLKAATLVKHHAFESVKDTYGSPGKEFWGFNGVTLSVGWSAGRTLVCPHMVLQVCRVDYYCISYVIVIKLDILSLHEE